MSRTLPRTSTHGWPTVPFGVRRVNPGTAGHPHPNDARRVTTGGLEKWKVSVVVGVETGPPDEERGPGGRGETEVSGNTKPGVGRSGEGRGGRSGGSGSTSERRGTRTSRRGGSGVRSCVGPTDGRRSSTPCTQRPSRAPECPPRTRLEITHTLKSVVGNRGRPGVGSWVRCRGWLPFSGFPYVVESRALPVSVRPRTRPQSSREHKDPG